MSTQGRNYWGSSLVYWLSAKFNTMDTSLGATKRPHASTPESTAAYEEQGNEKKRPCTEGGGEKKEETKVLRAEDFDEETLKKELNLAGKVGDLEKALELFDVSKKKGYQLNQKSCQVILHLLSGGEQWMELVESSANFCELSENPYKKSLCNRDKELYDYMKSAGHELNEFFYTGLARVAAICGDSEGALNIAQSAAKIKGKNKARLRTFAPALFAFCYSNNVKRAMEVENEIRRLEVQLTENEYRGIIDAIVRSKDTKYGSYVLECMLREITWIHHSTANSLARYFETYHERALEAGGETGETPLKYKVSRDCIVDTTGLCCGCDKKLQLLDLKQGEMKTLAEKIGLLAGKRESRNDAFGNFRRWVDRHGPFDIIIDAANVGFFGQAKGGVFTFMQVMELHREVKMKWPNSKPLIILHAKRYQHFVRTSRRNEEIMQELKKNHEIFATPPGSNDDWYWIYAAVHGGVNGLLVTNDELRDHIFQTLESKNFNRWKLAHQVSLCQR